LSAWAAVGTRVAAWAAVGMKVAAVRIAEAIAKSRRMGFLSWGKRGVDQGRRALSRSESVYA
jgi:hypothetical protein